VRVVQSLALTDLSKVGGIMGHNLEALQCSKHCLRVTVSLNKPCSLKEPPTMLRRNFSASLLPFKDRSEYL
jgi:hypothetical protein